MQWSVSVERHVSKNEHDDTLYGRRNGKENEIERVFTRLWTSKTDHSEGELGGIEGILQPCTATAKGGGENKTATKP